MFLFIYWNGIACQTNCLFCNAFEFKNLGIIKINYYIVNILQNEEVYIVIDMLVREQYNITVMIAFFRGTKVE